ncbi:MAG: haloacid dehalogenase type II [Proteobacteria bacterium]|nr:haloacid dehalogenase type II [Pseudomonadota bacterium]
MSLRPAVIAFDVMETLFSLEKLRIRLAAVGLPADALEVWFPQMLRDAFALEVSGVFHSFREVASSTLTGIALARGRQVGPDPISGVLDGFAELEPHPDVGIAFQRLKDANIRIVTLTNGSAEVTGKLVRRAGLEHLVERHISIDEVRHWKPGREVYLHAARCTGVEPRQLALVAAHAWDVHGAACAGLTTAFIARGKSYPNIMMPPGITAATLAEAAEALAQLPEHAELRGPHGEAL